MNNLIKGFEESKGRTGMVEIPNCDRLDLPELMVHLGYKNCVEIGTSKGWYAEKILQAGLKLFCVDPWIMYDDYYGRVNGKQEEFEKQYERTKALLAPFGEKAVIIKKTSMEAINDFEDGSIDCVYIDGNHEFSYVADDIHHWAKKVRKGGMIAGHDYIHIVHREYDNIHTKLVVDAYVRAYKIENFFVIGAKEKRPDWKRDFTRSWFWIKK